MPSENPPQLLRASLLEGLTVVLAGTATPPAPATAGALARSVHSICGELGAHVCDIPAADADGTPVEELALDAELERLLERRGTVELLAVDAQAMFAAGSGRSALVAGLEASWNATRALVNGAFMGAGRGGRVVYLAPAPDAGEHARAALAGLENLARTLSIEWARYGVTLVTIAPGSSTAADEAAALVAYLASPAGAYFSGCLLDLRGPTY